MQTTTVSRNFPEILDIGKSENPVNPRHQKIKEIPDIRKSRKLLTTPLYPVCRVVCWAWPVSGKGDPLAAATASIISRRAQG